MDGFIPKISICSAVTKALIESFPDVNPRVIDVSEGHEAHNGATGARVIVYLKIPLAVAHLNPRERHRRCVNTLKPLLDTGVLHSFEFHFRSN